MDTKYCLEHGEAVETFVLDGEYHMVYDANLDSFSCDGPFATCAPPELHLDWFLHTDEPGVEELIVMNENADQLLMELEGA